MKDLHIRAASAVALLVVTAGILGIEAGCKSTEGPLLIADPVFIAAYIADEDIGMRVLSIPFADSEKEIVKAIAERVEDRMPPVVLLSPVYSATVPLLADRYPDTTFYAFGFQDQRENIRTIPYDRDGALRRSADFVIADWKSAHEGEAPKVGVEFLVNTERRRKEYALLRACLEEKIESPLLFCDDIPRMKDKDAVKTLIEKIKQQNIDILFLFLGAYTPQALDLMESATIIITENTGRYQLPGSPILFSLETDYLGAVANLLAGQAVEEEPAPVPVVIRYNPDFEERIGGPLRDRFRGFQVVPLITHFKKKV